MTISHFLVVCAIFIFLFFSVSPNILTLLDPSIGILGALLAFFSAALFPVVWILSYVTSNSLIKKFRFKVLPSRITKLITGIVSSLWLVFVIITVLFVVLPEFISKTMFQVDSVIVKEEIRKVENRSGLIYGKKTKPWLYEYTYRFEIFNKTNRTFRDIPVIVEIGRDSSYEGFFWEFDDYRDLSDKVTRVDLKPGKNILEGYLPLFFIRNDVSGPVKVNLKFYTQRSLESSLPKEFRLLSIANIDWERIRIEQDRFLELYSVDMESSL